MSRQALICDECNTATEVCRHLDDRIAAMEAVADAARWLLTCEDDPGKRPVRGFDEAIEGLRHALVVYSKAMRGAARDPGGDR